MLFSKKTKKALDISAEDVLKIHQKPVSLLGGTGILIAVIVSLFFVVQKGSMSEFVLLALSMFIIFLLGLWDDLKWKHISSIRPLIKFFLLILFSLISALLLFYANFHFYIFEVPILAVFITFIYIFVMINAVNYQDGIDGLAGGLVFLSFIVMKKL